MDTYPQTDDFSIAMSSLSTVVEKAWFFSNVRPVQKPAVAVIFLLVKADVLSNL